MFTEEIGFFAFFGALLSYRLKPNFSWLTRQQNFNLFRLVLFTGFVCSVYCIGAGLYLVGTNYLTEVTTPVINNISQDPESLQSVHHPKSFIALGMILFAPWTLLLVGAIGTTIHLMYFVLEHKK